MTYCFEYDLLEHDLFGKPLRTFIARSACSADIRTLCAGVQPGGGVYRAGCAGRNGAVVVRRPVVHCTRVLVNGVYVKRCV